jgi:hypothetical protein
MFTLMMEAAGSSETSVHIYRTTRRHIPGDSNLHNHLSENFESRTQNGLFKLSLKLSLKCLRVAMLRSLAVSQLIDCQLVSLPVANLCN